MRTLGELE